jgi:DNA-binding PadR family transcriptional regulator
MTHSHPFEHPGFKGMLAMSAARGRGRRGRHRGGPWFGGWGGGPGFGPRRRRPRGDVRAAMLLVLADEPLSGYGLMQEIESRSEGVWRPSPGSVYPVLAQLEDEGLIRAEEEDGRKRFTLTDEGRTYVDEHREELGEPWAGLGDEVGEGRLELRALIGQLAAGAHQVATAGNDEQIEQAGKVLDDARRSLYRILAGDEPG